MHNVKHTRKDGVGCGMFATANFHPCPWLPDLLQIVLLVKFWKIRLA